MADLQQTERESLSVLLVDDEENILKSLRRLLMDEEDMEIVTATSGEDGLKILPELTNLALIVSDQRMPGMPGALFLEKAREIRPDAVRIILTGYADVAAAVDAINRGGAWRYLAKPWDDEELVRVIREAVDHYRREAHKRRLNEIISQQSREIESWNVNLKKRLLQSATTIREQSQALKDLAANDPVVVINRVYDRFFEVMGDRNAVHARIVSSLVTDVARKMGLKSETIARFRLAALLHDVGKFGSLAVELNKQMEEMSESEVMEYRQHPMRGEEMFDQIEELKEVSSLIRSHHESYDGHGFPDGLKGEKIPLGARLIAIADHIEKSARSVERHRADYSLMAARFLGGTLLDPHLITKFNSIVKTVYYEGRRIGMLSEVEVGPQDLIPGMLISRDVESGRGVLLIQRGSVLDSAGLALIRMHYKKNNYAHGIFIQVSNQ